MRERSLSIYRVVLNGHSTDQVRARSAQEAIRKIYPSLKFVKTDDKKKANVNVNCYYRQGDYLVLRSNTAKYFEVVAV